MTILRNIKWRFLISWKFFVGIVVPLGLIPLIYIPDIEIMSEDAILRPATRFKTAYVLIVMSIFWVFEIIPLPVTSLLPIVLLPSLGIQDAAAVSQNYTKESNMIFLGGVIIALGVEYCNLHRRIAIGVMVIVGASPVRLLFGTMGIVSLLSMWVSPPSCVAMLVPVVIAVIDEIHEAEAESPELQAEVRRRTSSVDYNNDNNPSRRFSSASTNSAKNAENKARRMSTVFGNSALSKPTLQHLSQLHRASVAAPSPPRKSSVQPGTNSKPLSTIIDEDVLETPPGSLGKNTKVGFSQESTKLGDIVSGGRGSSCSTNVSIDMAQEEAEDDNLKKPDDGSQSEQSQTEIDIIELRDDIKKMFLFGMAYAANLGGTAVITGSSPNKIFKEVIKPIKFDQDGKYRDITFFVWMALNVPSMIVEVLIAWIFLVCKYYYRVPNISSFFRRIFCCMRRGQNDEDNNSTNAWNSKEVVSFLENERKKLGPIGFHESAVGVIFIGVVGLWIFRDPEIFAGWDSLISGATTGESTAAMFGVILLFIFPKDWSFLTADESKSPKYEALLDWKFVATKMPWGVLLLLGSGFALSDAVEYSGLSDSIGKELQLLGDVSLPILLLIAIVVTNAFTQITPNVACANILLPIMLSMSISLGIHPLYLTVAATISCSHAFMLPVSAPSNAIVFAAGDFSTVEMVKNGLFLNIICVAVLFVHTLTYADWMFDFDNYEYPVYSGEEL